ncbi:MAG: restriction endonuclease PLD domain-containing protein [Sulfurimonadaceae bacterium]
MQIINNTTGLFENIYFKDTIIDKSIRNHKELLEIIIPQCSKLLIASPFLMDNFKPFFKDINIQNLEFELITTCKPQGDEQLVKPFQMKNFGLTIEEFSLKYPIIHLINKLHSKIYLFYKDNSIVLGIVTSANFTNSGLSNNHETGVILSDIKILENLEIDIRDNLEYINLTKNQIDDLCKEADLKKKDRKIEKQENIDINISKYLNKNNAQNLEEANQKTNNNEVFIDRSKEVNFEEFINKQILHNNQINILDLSNLNINTIPPNISKLMELKNINISNNNISILPDELFSLRKLEILDISDNKIILIPDTIKNLARTYPKVFHKLAIYGNKDIKIHIDITWIKSFKTIIVDKSIINKTLLIFKQFKDTNVQIIDKYNNNLNEYIEYCNNEILNDRSETLYFEYNQNIVKTCSRCDKELGLDKFYSSDKSSGKNNLYSYCKDCNSKEGYEKERKPKQILRNLYNKKIILQASKNNSNISYTKDEFVEFLENQQHFKKLYEEYKNNNYHTDLKPNFYLIDKHKNYSLDNIQICTTKEANEKHSQKNMGGKATIQFTLGGEPIQIFESTQEVTRQIGIADSGVCNSCNYNRQAGGYTFQYLENIKDTSILDKLNKIEKVNQCYVDDEDFLFELADNKNLEDYLKVILYFRNYEDQEIKEIIQEALLSNTNGYLLELFKKDLSELIEEFANGYSRIEAEHFDYLYGFVNIRYDESENIPILEILKIIAKNTNNKELIEFLMENKTSETIFIAIIENSNFNTNIEFLEKRIIKYYLKPSYIELANKILQIQELKTDTIKKIIKKVGEEQIINTLMSMNYLKTSTNKWIIDNFSHDEKKQDIINIESIQKSYTESKRNDEVLKELLVEFRENNIKDKFPIDNKCILSDSMIEQFLIYKPLNKEEFRNSKVNKNIDEKQLKFLDDIFGILEMADE